MMVDKTVGFPASSCVNSDLWTNVWRQLGATPSAINTRLFAELCRIGLIAS